MSHSATTEARGAWAAADERKVESKKEHGTALCVCSPVMKSTVCILLAACVCLAASHSITRDLVVSTPELFSELEDVKIDEPSNDVPFKNCGSPSDLVSISSLNLTPFPAKKGQTVSTLITGTLNKGFNTGKWSVTVQSGIIKKTVTGDICEDLKQKGKSCPVAAGPVNFNHDESIPAIAPSGSYHITSVSTGDTGQLFCIQFDMPIQDELEASPICRKCIETVSEVIMKHTVESIVEKCHHATDPATKAKCEFMRTHQNFTLGMLVEEVQPIRDAELYCMGAHHCRAAELELDTGDSTETELAEIGDMLIDIISAQPTADIFSSGADDCSSCVNAGDKAVMQDVITKVLVRIFLFHCCALAKKVKLRNRSKTFAPKPRIPNSSRCFCSAWPHLRILTPCSRSDALGRQLIPNSLLVFSLPRSIPPNTPTVRLSSDALRRYWLTPLFAGECVQQKLCPDPFTAAASRTGLDVATSIDF